MSLKVTLEEEPRVFAVFVGRNQIGRVTSFNEKTPRYEESYHAERFTNDEDEGEYLGGFATLREAGEKVVEYSYGPTEINKVIERIV